MPNKTTEGFIVFLTEKFEKGQWWVEEIEAVLCDGTDEQRRAVATLHNLLNQISNTANEVNYKFID